MMLTTAVLSLNGAPQLVLRDGEDTPSAPYGSATDSAKPQPPVVAGDATVAVMKLLGAIVRIKITDGRVLVGKFHCFDKHQNVILTDTREYVPPASHAQTHKPTGKKGKGKKEHHVQTEAELQEEEAKELWKTGTSRSLGMALVPGKHIVYIKVHQTAYDRVAGAH
ncbi:hypothetical protein Poli38472_013535 [Pythium oligandrum]|uniref:Sm domain-containing protein n=1 Tax=Pythium oligandrum TaxID=41045 RepID=A0A8K1C7Z0_PYTOL|nr:hypothetical protein Poli38472_013535 [Pythium oligandrum]|eukprot:TMW58061.1 hypothetical protein Poli38472_013535 [Pythium oligandrum]